MLLAAIRNDRPHNEAKRAAYSDLASIMGRAAVHSGKIITWDEALASNFQFCPNIDTLNESTPASNTWRCYVLLGSVTYAIGINIHLDHTIGDQPHGFLPGWNQNHHGIQS